MALFFLRLGAAAFGLAIVAGPAQADTFEVLDALSDASADETTGIALAREQATRGEYLEALATLERVLAENPKSREARLIHALFLCRVDDQQGGLVAIDKLKKKHYGAEVLDQARASCTQGAAS